MRLRSAPSATVVLERKRPAARVVPSSSARARSAFVMREVPSVSVLCIRAVQAAAKTGVPLVMAGSMSPLRYAKRLAWVRLATPSLR